MRTDAVVLLGVITVVTQDLEPWGEFIGDDPCSEILRFDYLPMCSAIVVLMVDAEEDGIRFLAASASTMAVRKTTVVSNSQGSVMGSPLPLTTPWPWGLFATDRALRSAVTHTNTKPRY